MERLGSSTFSEGHDRLEHRESFIGVSEADQAILVRAGLTYVRTGLMEIQASESAVVEDSQGLDENGLPAGTDLEELRERGVGITRSNPSEVETQIEMHRVAVDYGSGPLGYRGIKIGVREDRTALLEARQGWGDAGRFPELEVTLIESH